MSDASGTGEAVLHASAVALDGRGLLIVGASGTGKSTLAIRLMALGATLVSDDRVIARAMPGGRVGLSCPPATRGLIEARGVGLIRAAATEAEAVAVVDMDRTETRRLPDRATIEIAGGRLPLLPRVESPAFPDILLLYLKGGLAEA